MLLYILIALPASLVAFYLIRIRRTEMQAKRKRLSLVRAYKRMLLRHRMAVTHSEITGHRIIAVDMHQRKLLAVDHSGNSRQEQCIPLAEIKEAQVCEERNEKGHIDRIFLELKHKDGETVYRICFFNHSSDNIAELPALARRARQWKSRVEIYKRPGSITPAGEYVL